MLLAAQLLGAWGRFKFKQALCFQLDFIWMLNTQKSGSSFQMSDFKDKWAWALDLETGLHFKRPQGLKFGGFWT